MTRNAVVLALVCALAGALFYAWKLDDESRFLETQKKALEAKMLEKGTVVYALRDVARGAPITVDCIEERATEQSKIPGRAACKISEVLGRKAKYGISKDQVLSLYDLDPPPPGITSKIVRVVRPIKQGELIQADDLDELEKEAIQVPMDAVPDIATAVGQKAIKDIMPGNTLTTRYLVEAGK